MVIVVIVVYGITLFISFRAVRGDKNKELEVKEDPYRHWKSAGTSMGLIGLWLARGLLSNLSQKEALLLMIIIFIYVSFTKIPDANRAYRLYLEWKEE